MAIAAERLQKLNVVDLQTLRARVDLPPSCLAATEGSADAVEALARLTDGGFLLEAVRLMAHALPRREGVWWGCMCAVATAPPDLPESDGAARQAAEEWVRRQTDALRRAAMAHARRAGFQTPEAWCGAAAFWSGDSMTELDQAPVPPAPHLTGVALAGAVTLSSVRGSAERQMQRLERFLVSGRDIAAGGPGRLAPEAG